MALTSILRRHCKLLSRIVSSNANQFKPCNVFFRKVICFQAVALGDLTHIEHEQAGGSHQLFVIYHNISIYHLNAQNLK